MTSTASSTDETALRFDSRLKRFLRDARTTTRSESFDQGDLTAWRPLIDQFLELISRPVLRTLSPAYQQGTRLEDLTEDAIRAFGAELAIDGHPIQALRRFSELDAVRILTTHKCKSLEFQKVVVLGVEHEFFWATRRRPRSSWPSPEPRTISS